MGERARRRGQRQWCAQAHGGKHCPRQYVKCREGTVRCGVNPWGLLMEACAGEMKNAVLEGDGSLASLFFVRKEGMFSAYAVYSRTDSRLGRGG